MVINACSMTCDGGTVTANSTCKLHYNLLLEIHFTRNYHIAQSTLFIDPQRHRRICFTLYPKFRTSIHVSTNGNLTCPVDPFIAPLGLVSFYSVRMGNPKHRFKDGAHRKKFEGFEHFDCSRESPKLAKCENEVVQSCLAIKSGEEKDTPRLREDDLTKNGNGCCNDMESRKAAEREGEEKHLTKKKSKKRKLTGRGSDPEEELHVSTEKATKKKRRGNKKSKGIQESKEQFEMKEMIGQTSRMKQKKPADRLDKKLKTVERVEKNIREGSDDEEEEVTKEREINEEVKRKDKGDSNAGKKAKREQIEKMVRNEQKKWEGQKLKRKLDSRKNATECQQTPWVADRSDSSLDSEENDILGCTLRGISSPNENHSRVKNGDGILSDSREIHHYNGSVQSGKEEKHTRTTLAAVKSLQTDNHDVGDDVGSSPLDLQKPAFCQSFEKLNDNCLPRSGRRCIEHQPGTPFKRVMEGQISFENECLMDNSFHSKNDTYGIRAHHDLVMTKGKGFRKEKTKKKRLNHHGGKINYEVNSYQFSDSD